VIRIASVLLGAALLAWLVVSSDIASILADLSRIGPRLVVILAIEFAVDAFNTLGWWFTLPGAKRGGAYRWLFWVRSAGNALNEATPTASLGGEAAKIVLLRHRMPSATAAASLLVARLSQSSAKAIFIAAGLAAVWSRLRLPREASLALVSGFALVLIGIALFAAMQVRGLGMGTINALRHARIPARWIVLITGWLHGVDAHLRDFYRAQTSDLARSMGANFCGFACGTLQILLMMGWLGLPFDPAAALGIEAFSTLIGFLMFVVPGSLGVQEGGKVLIFAALGLPRSAAMAVGITFRLISLTEIAMGLAAWVVLQHRMRGWPARPRTMRDSAP
jgi:glycosyltransferase 2 family protein